MVAVTADRVVVELEARIDRYNRNIAQAPRTFDRSMGRIEARANRTNMLLSRFGSGLLAGAIGTVGIRALSTYADTWIRVENQLRVVGLEGEALQTTLEGLFDIAQRHGQAIEPLTALYGRLAQAQGELGATSEEISTFVDSVAAGLRVQGSTAQEARGALIQLSQAMGGAIVRAEEFNSINEGARPILQAAANGLKEAGGSVSKLRNLVIEGKVSSEAFFRAFLVGSRDLRSQADGMESTIGQAITRIENSFGKLVSRIDETGKVSEGIAEIFGRIADSFEYAADNADELYAKLKPVLDVLTQLYELTPGKLIMDFVGGDPADLYKTDPMEDAKRRLAAELRKAQGGSADPITLADYPPPGEDDDKKSRERAKAYDREVKSINRRTEALLKEAEIYGQSTFAIEKSRVAMELLNAAKDQGLKITPELEAEIDDLSTAYANAAVEMERVEQEQQRLNDTAGAFGDAVGGAFAILVQGGEDLEVQIARLVVQLLLAIAQAKILNSTLANTPTGSFLSSLLGGFKGWFASGGTIPAGQWGMAGEKGAEPIFAKPGGGIGVVSNQKAFRAPGNARNGVSRQEVTVTVRGEPGPVFNAVVSDIAGDVAGPIAVQVSNRRVRQFGRRELEGRLTAINGWK